LLTATLSIVEAFARLAKPMHKAVIKPDDVILGIFGFILFD
jgi:hypothetical protein